MGKGLIYSIGIGPGGRDLLPLRAKEAIGNSSVVAGYTAYLDQIRDMIEEKKVISTSMRGEVERCRLAVDEADKGNSVAVVCSGDSGIYGMAGLLLEIIDEKELDIEVEVIPGITAANAAAAILGAPLMNDFAVISLSDLLTPADEIRARIEGIASADLVCVLYNPRSRKRIELLDEVLAKFADLRGADIVCGYVKHAYREQQQSWCGKIFDLNAEEVDMSTVIIIGNSKTVLKNNKIYTIRGYRLD